jgi:hypothetical protein
MKFAMYRGESLISRLIGWQTRSVYSHVALWFQDCGDVYEAVASGFVKAGSLVENHEPGAKVDVLEYELPLTPKEDAAARLACAWMVGTPYDYRMVFAGFPLRYDHEPAKNRRQFFCSEAAVLVAQAIRRPIVSARVPAWKCSPEDVHRSVALIHTMSLEL